MKHNRILSMLLVLAMLLAAVPATASTNADYASREVAIYAFVEAVGRDGFSQPPADLSAFSDGEKATNPELMALAVGNGLIRGYEDNTIRPDASITRLEALIILGRCLPEIEEKRPSTEFTDVPDWAAEEIDRLYRGEIVNGYGNGRLGSSDNISFEQVNMLTDRVKPSKASEVSLKDDFYNAVNRDFFDGIELGNEHEVSKFTEVQGEIDRRLIEISREITEAYQAGSYGKNTIESEAARFYLTALEGFSYNGALPSSFNYLLRRINEARNLSELIDASADIFSNYAIGVLLDISTPYKKTGNGRTSVLSDPIIDFSGSDCTPEDWDIPGAEAAYTAYLAKLLKLLSFSDAENLARNVSRMNIEVDKASMTRQQRLSLGRNENDSEDEENVFGYFDISERYGRSNPVSLMLFYLAKHHQNKKDDMDVLEESFIISDLGRMNKAVELLEAADIETLRAAAAVNLAEGFMTFMPKAYRDAEEEFQRVIFDNRHETTAEEFATGLTASLYKDLYEKLYLEKYTDFDRDGLAALTEEIKACFEEKLQYSSVVSPATATKGMGKLDKMDYSVALSSGDYQETIDSWDYFMLDRDPTFTETGLKLMSREDAGLYASYTCVNIPLPCYTVNAYYSHLDNSFSVCAGLLESPIYSLGETEEELLGGIGTVIAHEIAHAFDESGSFYDSKGDYAEWWQESDYDVFKKRTDKLAEIYSGYVTAGGNPIDALLTSDENIADIMAMDCIITLAKKKGLDLDAVFRAYAGLWAELRSPEYDAYCASFDVHADGKTRVNAVLSNFDEFYETYSITEGDGMYRSPENRVKLI